MKKVLVTGGAGFIGSNLVDRLIEDEFDVVIVDDLSTGKIEYINAKAKFYKIDICNEKEIEEIFEKEKFKFVFHLAAQIDVRISVNNPELDNKINVLGSLNILKNCHKYGVEKIVFISTGGAIYGDTESIPTKEAEPEMPLSPYGIHKLTFEKYLNYFNKVYGQRYAALRLANVYGPRQYKGGEAGVVSIFVDHAVAGQQITINGDGLQTRDFVYVRDVVNACLASIKIDFCGEINISTAKETSLLEIINIIEKVQNIPMEKIFGPAKDGEQRRSCLDYGKAEKILNWQPQVALEEGIKMTIEWAKGDRI